MGKNNQNNKNNDGEETKLKTKILIRLQPLQVIIFDTKHVRYTYRWILGITTYM